MWEICCTHPSSAQPVIVHMFVPSAVSLLFPLLRSQPFTMPRSGICSLSFLPPSSLCLAPSLSRSLARARFLWLRQMKYRSLRHELLWLNNRSFRFRITSRWSVRGFGDLGRERWRRLSCSNDFCPLPSLVLVLGVNVDMGVAYGPSAFQKYYGQD